MKTLVALLLVSSTACSLATSLRSSVTSDGRRPPLDDGGRAPDGPHGFSTILVRDQLASLRGLSIDAARARAKALGHVGAVEVRPRTGFLAGCADGVVCAATGEGGVESGIGVADLLVLWINPSLGIAPPP